MNPIVLAIRSYRAHVIAVSLLSAVTLPAQVDQSRADSYFREAAALGASVAPGVLRAIISRAGDCSVADVEH